MKQTKCPHQCEVHQEDRGDGVLWRRVDPLRELETLESIVAMMDAHTEDEQRRMVAWLADRYRAESEP